MGIMQLLLASAPVEPRLTAITVTSLKDFGSSAIVSVTFGADGQLGLYTNSAIDIFPTGEWLSSAPDATNAALYEVRAVLAGGTSPNSGTMGTWQALNTNRSWQVEQVVPGTKISAITFEIRLIGTSTTLASAVITLEAEVLA